MHNDSDCVGGFEGMLDTLLPFQDLGVLLVFRFWVEMGLYGRILGALRVKKASSCTDDFHRRASPETWFKLGGVRNVQNCKNEDATLLVFMIVCVSV